MTDKSLQLALRLDGDLVRIRFVKAVAVPRRGRVERIARSVLAFWLRMHRLGASAGRRIVA